MGPSCLEGEPAVSRVLYGSDAGLPRKRREELLPALGQCRVEHAARPPLTAGTPAGGASRLVGRPVLRVGDDILQRLQVGCGVVPGAQIVQREAEGLE